MRNEYSDEEGRKKEGKMRGRGEMRVNSIMQHLLVSFSSFLPVLFLCPWVSLPDVMRFDVPRRGKSRACFSPALFFSFEEMDSFKIVISGVL